MHEFIDYSYRNIEKLTHILRCTEDSLTHYAVDDEIRYAILFCCLSDFLWNNRYNLPLINEQPKFFIREYIADTYWYETT